MIIDSHTHVGKILNFNMPEDMLLSSMEKYGINFSLVSNIESTEVDHKQVELPLKERHSQLEVSENLINFTKKYPNKLGALLWIQPRFEGCTMEFQDFIEENREYIYGLKVHPYHSKYPFDGEAMIPYFETAIKYNLPIVTHTAGDYESSPELVENIAKRFPALKIVLVHLGLGTDNEKAIEIVARNKNLYGDVTWVKAEKMLRAIKICGADKIMFGTDSPINGEDTYDDDMFYNYCFDGLKKDINPDDYDKVMYATAAKLFGIKI